MAAGEAVPESPSRKCPRQLSTTTWMRTWLPEDRHSVGQDQLVSGRARQFLVVCGLSAVLAVVLIG